MPRVRIAATLAANDKFELFNVQYRITTFLPTPEGVVIRFQVDEETTDVHSSVLVLPPTAPFHIL